MKTNEQVLTALTRQKPMLRERFKVRSIALFGSYARGEQTEDSDVDILVDVDPAIGLEFVTLANTLESVLGQSVELVSTRALKPRAREHTARARAYRTRSHRCLDAPPDSWHKTSSRPSTGSAPTRPTWTTGVVQDRGAPQSDRARLLRSRRGYHLADRPDRRVPTSRGDRGRTLQDRSRRLIRRTRPERWAVIWLARMRRPHAPARRTSSAIDASSSTMSSLSPRWMPMLTASIGLIWS